jgi:hypothetical protein
MESEAWIMSDGTQTQELVVSPSELVSYPRREDLIVLNGWEPPKVGPVLDQMKLEVIALLEVAGMSSEIESQPHADELAKTIGLARRFIDDVEALSKALRSPYRMQADLIKKVTDGINGEVLLKMGPADNLLAEFETRKQLTKQHLDRQAEQSAAVQREEAASIVAQNEQLRQAEEVAEAEEIEDLKRKVASAKGKEAREEATQRLADAIGKAAANAAQRKAQHEAEQGQLSTIAPAPISYQPEKTEGVNSKTALTWDVIDPKAFARWIWENNRDEWIREVQFNKRSITEWIEAQKLPKPTDVPIIPGVKVTRVLAINVAKAPRAKKAIDVATKHVPLDAPTAQPDNWIETPHSSQISKIGYDSKQQILKIVFKNGSIYDYWQVPHDVFEGFRSAPSVGTYFAKTVKGVFAFQKRL